MVIKWAGFLNDLGTIVNIPNIPIIHLCNGKVKTGSDNI